MKSKFLLIPLLGFASCQTNGEDPQAGEQKLPVVEPAEVPIDLDKPDTLLGRRLERVQAAATTAEVPHRVVEVDGESRPVTMDYRPERLNFKVRGGRITDVTKG